MNIAERPIWDEERGLMTAEEHYRYLRDYELEQERLGNERTNAIRLAGNLFDYSDLERAMATEQTNDGIRSWRQRRIRYALARSCYVYWPTEWIGKRGDSYDGAWTVTYELPETLRHGRTMTEVLSLLVGYSLRTRNTKAAVRNFLSKPRAFLEREERHLVRKRLAK